MRSPWIGYREALDLTLRALGPLGYRRVSLPNAINRVVAEAMYALVDSPSVNASMKDGYAVRSSEVIDATEENPIILRVTGTVTAGDQRNQTIIPGTTLRIMTGAKLPEGADSVVSEEFVLQQGDLATVIRSAEPGRNILTKGSDISLEELIVPAGTPLVPGIAGTLAAGGYADVPVFETPFVALIATGDEVVVPGQSLSEGKVFASNLITLSAWCARYGMQVSMDVCSDTTHELSTKLEQAIDSHDAVLTSGGAWTGDRDYVVDVLESLGWHEIFHRIRMGPGKAVGFGFLKGKPVFILPGGPPSNLVAFLKIALPGLLKLSGFPEPRLPKTAAILTKTLSQIDRDWTQFAFGSLEERDGTTFFHPVDKTRRLQSMGRAQGLAAIPEGMSRIPEGERILIDLLV